MSGVVPHGYQTGGGSGYLETVVEDTTGLLSGQSVREKVWVIRHASNDWEMFFVETSNTDAVWRATSTDGVSWSVDTTNSPVISESFAIQDICVLIDGGTYYGYVENAGNGADGIRQYTSGDGLSWTFDSKYSNTYNPQSPVVKLNSGTWYLFYEKYDGTPYYTRYATSTDGLNWTDQGTAYDDANTQSVPDDVFKAEGKWYLYYHDVDGTYDARAPAEWATASSIEGPYTYGGQLADRSTTTTSLYPTSPTVVHNPDGTYYGAVNGTHYVYTWADNIELYSSTPSAASTVGRASMVLLNRGVKLPLDQTNIASDLTLVRGSGDPVDGAAETTYAMTGPTWGGGHHTTGLDFDPANSPRVDIGATPTLSAYTIVFVGKHRSVSDGNIHLDLNLLANNQVQFGTWGDGTVHFLQHDGSSQRVVSAAVSNGVVNCWVLTWDGSGTSELWKNGTSQGTASPGAMNNVGDPTDYIGGDHNDAHRYSDAVHDMWLRYDDKKSDAWIQDLTSKLGF